MTEAAVEQNVVGDLNVPPRTSGAANDRFCMTTPESDDAAAHPAVLVTLVIELANGRSCGCTKAAT